MSRWLVYLKSELTRRNLLRGGALLTATLALPGAPGCSGDTAAGTGGTGTNGGTGTSGSGPGSTSGSTSGATGSSGTTGATCTQDANTFSVAASQIPVGGAVVFTDARFNDPLCGSYQYPPNQFVIAQPTAGNFVALSAACTHECCSVEVRSSFLFCACHGSEFNFNGTVKRGPANQPLPSLSVCTDGTTVFVQLA